jgi:hypothetical protein
MVFVIHTITYETPVNETHINRYDINMMTVAHLWQEPQQISNIALTAIAVHYIALYIC